jgi:hypothetical protein
MPALYDAEITNSRRAYYPKAVSTFEEAGLSNALIESLILK